MTKHKSFSSLATSLVICLTLFAIISSQVIPVNHKPLLLDLNHKTNQRTMKLNFSFSHYNKPITVYRGYTFIFTFPDNSFETDTKHTCEVISNLISISSDSFENIASDIAGSTLKCILNSKTPLEGVRFDPSAQVTFNLGGLRLKNNFYNRVSIGLYTSDTDGVLITQTPAFRSFATYGNYLDMADVDTYLRLKDIEFTNHTDSLDCNAPCRNLYPWSEFSMTFIVEVRKFINSEEAYIAFQILGINEVIPTVISISSTEATNSNSTASTTLFSKLSSSSVTGDLELVKIDNSIYVIKDIRKTINSSTSVLNLVPGRSFTLTLGGFYTARNVDVTPITTLNALVIWKNTMSFLSYNNNTFSTNILPMTFKTAVDKSTDLSTAIQHYNGLTSEIYENGNFQLFFQLRIPKADAGKLRIEHVANINNVFSFYASTCDFSDSMSATQNSFGNRPVCYPVYPDNTTTSNNETINWPMERSVLDSNNNPRNSAFEIQLDQVKNGNYVIKISVWGFANRCSDSTIDNDGNLAFADPVMGAALNSFNLKFNLYFVIDGKNYIKSEDIDSKVSCFKNIREFDFSRYNDYSLSKLTNKFVKQNAASSPVNSFENDYILYSENYSWLPFTGTLNVNIPTTNLNTSDITVTNISTLTTTLNEITEENTNFRFTQVSSDYDNLLKDLALPYSQFENQTNQLSSKLLSGYYELEAPSLITDSVAENNQAQCYLTWFTESVGSTPTRATAVFVNNYTSNNEKYKLTLSKDNGINKLKTSSVNKASFQNMMNYNSKDIGNSYRTLSFNTSCVKYKTFSNYKIKNIYTAVSFNLKYYREVQSTYKLNRVIRFVKYFNSSFGFRNNNRKNITTATINLYRPNTYSNNAYLNQLCLLEVQSGILDTVSENHNTFLLTFLNTRLPLIGDALPTDFYPVSKLNENVNALPLYSEAGNQITNENLNTGNSKLSIQETITKAELYNGIQFDRDNYASIQPFLGSSIVFYGYSNDRKIAPANSNVYLPMFCGNNNIGVTLQSMAVINGEVDKTNFTIVTFKPNVNDDYKFYFSSSSIVSNNNLSPNDSVKMRFKHYRVKDGVDLNDFSANSSGDISSVSTAILLTKNISSNPNLKTNDNEFFGLDTALGNYRNFKLNKRSYDNIFFTIPDSSINVSLDSNKVEYLLRPSISNISSSVASLHGTGKRTGNTDSNVRVYFSNETEQNRLVEYPTSTGIVLTKTTTSAINITAVAQGTVYKNDFGMNFLINISIYSDLLISNAVLKLYSPNFKSKTICVLTSDPNNICVNDQQSAMICSNINLLQEDTVRFSLSCYNVNISSNAKFTISKLTNLTKENYINVSFDTTDTNDYIINYEDNNTLPDVSTIIPQVTSIDFVQVRQTGGLGAAYLKIDLGRTYRIGQTIILRGALNNLYFGNKRPNCSYMFTSNSSSLNSSNLSNVNFYDETSSSNYFVNKCVLSDENGDGHTMTITTRNYVPKTSAEFSQYILIRLDPVIVSEIKNEVYTIFTYIDDDSTAIISSNRKKMSFPALNPNIPTTLEVISPQNESGLCNLSSLFPRMPSSIGQLVFSISLPKVDDYLQIINKNITSKEFNEVSIYMDPKIYPRNEGIWCEYKSGNAACSWNSQGFINIRFDFGLTDQLNLITIKGISLPNYSNGVNDSDFYCSVNYYKNDDRENLLVGKGSFNANFYTYNPSNRGNLIFYTPKNGLVSSSTPRDFSTHYFRFIPDYTLKLSSVQQTFSTTNSTAKPVILVAFPKQYDLSLVSSDSKVNADLTYTSFDSDNSNIGFNTPVKLSISSVSVVYNYVIIELERIDLIINSNTAYLDLSVMNIPNPIIATTQPSDISVSILNNISNPNKIFTSYVNINNNFGLQVGSKFNDYYQGPSFIFRDDGKGLIEPESPVITIFPGRFSSISFTVTGVNANGSTNLRLNDRAIIFDTLEDSVHLNTGLTRTAVIRIGTYCETLYGSYWATFSLENNSSAFYKLSPIRINVAQSKGNKGLITLSSTLNGSDSSTYSIANGGFSTVYLRVNQAPFLDLNINITEDSNNNSTFKSTNSGTQNILRGKTWSYFSYKINQKVDTDQLLTLTSTDVCFGFSAQSNSDNVTSKLISFKLDQVLTDLTKIDLAEKFFYINPPADQPLNEMRLSYIPTINTKVVFALVCRDSNFPTLSNSQSMTALELNSVRAKFQSHYHYTTDEQVVVFSNLQRGTNFKLRAWITNFAIDSFPISMDFTEIRDKSNTTRLVDLRTTDVEIRRFIEFKFTSQQTDAWLDRLLKQTQYYVNRNDNSAAVIVTNQAGKTVEGYNVVNRRICIDVTANSLLGLTITNLSALNSTNQTTTGLRYLQEEEDLISNNENVTDSNSNNPNTTSPDDVEVGYNQTTWILFSQTYNDSGLFNSTELVLNYLDQVNTASKIGLFADNLNEKFTGDLVVSEVRDDPLLAKDFQTKDFTYNSVIGRASLIPIGPQNLTCYWKLQRITSIGLDPLDPLVIKDCPVQPYGSTQLLCGKTDFKVNNQEPAYLSIGYLSAGNYYVNFLCESIIPQSFNQVVFRNDNMFNVVEVPVEVNTSLIPPVNCTETPTDVTCISSLYVYMSYMMMIVVLSLMFDF